MTKINIFLILIYIFSSAAVATADTRRAALLPEDLEATAWQGSYSAAGVTGPIKIAFLPELTGDGKLQYFHKVAGDGEAPGILKKFDVACPLTPRALRLSAPDANGNLGGKISVYPCVKNETTEIALEKNRRTRSSFPIPQVPVTQLVFTDPQHLNITAKIGPLEVHYSLKLNPDVPKSRADLHAWVSSPFPDSGTPLPSGCSSPSQPTSQFFDRLIAGVAEWL